MLSNGISVASSLQCSQDSISFSALGTVATSIRTTPGVLHELLPHALADLSQPERRLIQQLFCDGNTEAEIVQCLGISHQAVSKRKRAALRHMRAQFVIEIKKK